MNVIGLCINQNSLFSLSFFFSFISCLVFGFFAESVTKFITLLCGNNVFIMSIELKGKTQIQVSKLTREVLKSLRLYERETYDEVLQRLLKGVNAVG